MNINILFLFLLPSYIDSITVENNLDSLLNASFVFKQLYELEKAIQPIISTIEENGIIIDSKWITDEIKRVNQLFKVDLDLSNLINVLNKEKQQGNEIARNLASHLSLWVAPYVEKLAIQPSNFRIRGHWNLFSLLQWANDC
ncbi:hypothetical protein ACWTWI_03280 [Staphylococcus hominis]